MDEKEKTQQKQPEQDPAKEAGKQPEALANENPNDGVPQQKPQAGTNYVEEARRENDRREELLKREEELQTRKEKLAAEEMVTGRGQIVNSEPAKPDPKAYGRSIMEGKLPDGK